MMATKLGLILLVTMLSLAEASSTRGRDNSDAHPTAHSDRETADLAKWAITSVLKRGEVFVGAVALSLMRKGLDKKLHKVNWYDNYPLLLIGCIVLCIVGTFLIEQFDVDVSEAGNLAATIYHPTVFVRNLVAKVILCDFASDQLNYLVFKLKDTSYAILVQLSQICSHARHTLVSLEWILFASSLESNLYICGIVVCILCLRCLSFHTSFNVVMSFICGIFVATAVSVWMRVGMLLTLEYVGYVGVSMVMYLIVQAGIETMIGQSVESRIKTMLWCTHLVALGAQIALMKWAFGLSFDRDSLREYVWGLLCYLVFVKKAIDSDDRLRHPGDGVDVAIVDENSVLVQQKKDK